MKMNNVKKFEYTDILGWSMSRYDRFLSCKRRYFYDYYAKFDTDISLEKIQFLKSLTSKPLEAGNIVHSVIKDILKRYQTNIKPINRNKFFDYLFETTKKHCNSKIFFEYYYNGEIVLPSEIYTKTKSMLENLLNSLRFKWIGKSAISQSSEWIIEPEGFGETRINNLKAFCKVDFLFPSGNKLYIMDWKTGKPEKKKHSKQLLGYSLWANYHLGQRAENIVPIVVYLYPQYSEKNIEVDDRLINEFTEIVLRETEDMYAYLMNVKKNIPKAKGEFPLTSNTFFCEYCSYKEICVDSARR
jgi:CRISPR/Cas system-associated exonuclease Cas4 (RecB family)